jgi:tripartite-type tricarboxylate transporter receptor subunit TctC
MAIFKVFTGAILGTAFFIATAFNFALAQDFPARPVTLIVPWPAGGVTDVAMRALAKATERYLGQAILIKNQPGASGTLGPMHMARMAEPDGYTLTQVPERLFRVPFIQDSAFDPANDLTYIIGLTGYTFGVAVKNDAPWKTFQDFLADAKSHPGKIRYGSPGFGTTPHLVMMQIERQQSIDWVHVPFKGSSETPIALLGGQVDAVADGSSWAPMVSAGKLRLLVTFDSQRSANWPTVPTLKEIGIDLIANAPYGLAGPKGMDPNIVKILHDAIRKGMEDPQYTAALRQLGQQPFYMSSEDYRTFAIHEVAKQKQLIENLGLKKY